MICVTHEMGFTKTVANRLIFMDGGEIIEIAEPRGLLHGAEKRPHAAIFEPDLGALGGARGFDGIMTPRTRSNLGKPIRNRINKVKILDQVVKTRAGDGAKL